MPLDCLPLLPRRALLRAALLLPVAAAASARAAGKMTVVASFSILADLVGNVGGDRVKVIALVGPDSDVHVYSPTPADAKTVATARLIVVNGLGLEGWMMRLVEATGSKAPVVVASRGVAPLARDGKDGSRVDPHAWQSVANAKIYVANIRDGLAAVDPAGKDAYAANAAAYLVQLDALDAQVKAGIARIPPAQRNIVTSHDAFAYFGAAYGVRFIAPESVVAGSEASAREVAAIVTRIRRQHTRTLFAENISDPRLLQQIARESGAAIDGTLYSDALSPPSGPAATYIALMRNNLRQFVRALAP
jgi:zinc/manganese transport system substrate-binding protein